MKSATLTGVNFRQRLLTCVAAAALIGSAIPLALASEEARVRDDATASPIKHLIIIIGENRSFDHVFATYKPVHSNEKVLNLLSQGIVRPDGSPGPNYGAALQYTAYDFGKYQ